MKWTYYQNVVDSSYSFAFWDSTRWEAEIDWMCLTGVNLALMYTGQESVLQDLYAELGINLTSSSASGERAFFNGPAFLSWSRGQRQSDVGGADAFDLFNNRSTAMAIAGGGGGDGGGDGGGGARGALPTWFIQQQRTLGKWQATRMRELGITTILRGFEGNVPAQVPVCIA
jgi:hypothetical protein